MATDKTDVSGVNYENNGVSSALAAKEIHQKVKVNNPNSPFKRKFRF